MGYLSEETVAMKVQIGTDQLASVGRKVWRAWIFGSRDYGEGET